MCHYRTFDYQEWSGNRYKAKARQYPFIKEAERQFAKRPIETGVVIRKIVERYKKEQKTNNHN